MHASVVIPTFSSGCGRTGTIIAIDIARIMFATKVRGCGHPTTWVGVAISLACLPASEHPLARVQCVSFGWVFASAAAGYGPEQGPVPLCLPGHHGAGQEGAAGRPHSQSHWHEFPTWITSSILPLCIPPLISPFLMCFSHEYNLSLSPLQSPSELHDCIEKVCWWLLAYYVYVADCPLSLSSMSAVWTHGGGCKYAPSHWSHTPTSHHSHLSSLTRHISHSMITPLTLHAHLLHSCTVCRQQQLQFMLTQTWWTCKFHRSRAVGCLHPPMALLPCPPPLPATRMYYCNKNVGLQWSTWLYNWTLLWRLN